LKAARLPQTLDSEEIGGTGVSGTRREGLGGGGRRVRGRTGDTFDSPGARVLDSPARSANRLTVSGARMIDKLARSLRKRTGRLLGAPVKP